MINQWLIGYFCSLGALKTYFKTKTRAAQRQTKGLQNETLLRQRRLQRRHEVRSTELLKVNYYLIVDKLHVVSVWTCEHLLVNIYSDKAYYT